MAPEAYDSWQLVRDKGEFKDAARISEDAARISEGVLWIGNNVVPAGGIEPTA